MVPRPLSLPVAIWQHKSYIKTVFGIPGNHQETAETLLAIGVFLLAAYNLASDRAARAAQSNC